MNIVILGAGELGSHLAKALSEEQHNVTLIDKDQDALSRFSQSADVGTLCNAKTNWETLNELPDKSSTIFIGMTSNDDTNLIGSDVAKELGYPKTIVRVSQKTYLDQFSLNYAELFRTDHFIAPELIVAKKLLRKILHPYSVTNEIFNNGDIQLLIVRIPPDAKNLQLPPNVSLCLIHRDGKTLIVDQNAEIKPGDEVGFLGYRQAIDQVPEHFSKDSKKIGSVFLCGGRYIARELCPLLLDRNIHVKVIESDETICKELSKELPNMTILNHDETDYEFYLEEQVHLSDIFIGGTEKTEKNILAASLAQEAGVENVFCVTHDRTYFHLLHRLNISHALSRRMTIANYVLSILYSGNIIQAVSLYENQAKVVQVRIPEGSRFIGKTTDEIRNDLPKDMHIALSISGAETFLPHDSHQLVEGDCLFIATSQSNMAQLEKAFA